jgi:hypothetical protein
MSGPVEDVVQRLNARRSGKSWIATCPAHEDNNPSLSIDEGADGRALIRCHAGCDTNKVLSALGMTPRDLFPRDCQSNVNGAAASGPQSESKARSTKTLNWRVCVEAFTEKHVERLAKWRGYSMEFCSSLREDAFVGLYSGCIAFPVRDPAGNVVAVHYRLKDGSWRYYPQGAKVRPLVIGELVAGEPVHIFESQWDGFAFMDVSGEHSGVIVTRGASNGGLASGLIPERSTVYVWTQNDEAGEKWQKDICNSVKATVKRARIQAPHKDLNDWTRGGVSADNLFAAMVNAEVVREAEQSWTDALNAAVVTSSELHGLELRPRKKLLEDWFCEGDLGFIFAFRGIGKTWLALAIARALSSGGTLGDWQAHERVKVLYIDGEMPPDLMRDRCDGLQSSNDLLQFLNHEILFERTGKVLNITNREIQQAITHHCIVNRAKVLILDNLSTLASGMRENEADSWELVNNWLLDLRRRKIAAIIVHHAGRSGEMRGTSKREDNVFWIIALDDAKKNADDKRGARFVSRFTKPSRNTQEELPAYEWHFVTDDATGVVSIEHKQAQTMDVFLGLIEDGVTECGQVAQEMKVSPATISRLAKKAIDAGKIIKVKREYMLAEGEKMQKK